MGLGPNVTLVFNSALNIVLVLEPLLFVNVVQLLFRLKFAKKGVLGQNFRRRRLWRRKKSIITLSFRKKNHFLRGDNLPGEHLRSQFFVKMYQIWPKVNQNRVIWGLGRPQEALLLFRALNVKLLLFTEPIVVLLLLLTIRTVFSA